PHGEYVDAEGMTQEGTNVERAPVQVRSNGENDEPEETTESRSESEAPGGDGADDADQVDEVRSPDM
ncbi:MAG: hypothetical protein HKN17_10765, partial [Rhodothermales bacterium]|nr:hypothetical protein [Rhodothermales bacterium]